MYQIQLLHDVTFALEGTHVHMNLSAMCAHAIYVKVTLSFPELLALSASHPYQILLLLSRSAKYHVPQVGQVMHVSFVGAIVHVPCDVVQFPAGVVTVVYDCVSARVYPPFRKVAPRSSRAFPIWSLSFCTHSRAYSPLGARNAPAKRAPIYVSYAWYIVTKDPLSNWVINDTLFE